MQTSLAFALVLVLTSALTVVAILLIAGAFRGARPRSESPMTLSGDAAFLFDGQALIDTNTRGAVLLDSLHRTEGDDRGDWARLTRFLALDFPDFSAALGELPLTRRARLVAAEDRRTELALDWLDGALRLTLIDTQADDAAVLMDRLSLRALQDELSLLRQITESAPLPMWREGEQGQVIWANGAYLKRVAEAGGSDSMTWPLPVLFPRADAGPPRRIALAAGGSARQAWFDVIRQRDSAGTLAYALPADEAHQAERTKRDFIQTLTKTFATLPTGLAIFDRTRRLQVFNPALTDLTGLEPEFLLSRPGIEGFLNRMRDKRVLPEPRDYRSWSKRLLEIETATPRGEFEETWSLPTGQTFRVSASPHPDGALAFLIEDITSETHLARHVRAEAEVSQSVLNQLDEAIAVFAPNGELVLTNTAFSRLWAFEGEEALIAVTLPEALETWREVGEDGGFWSRVAALARPGQSDGQSDRQHDRLNDRQPLRGTMCLADGETLTIGARRTSTGALMISFAERAPAFAEPHARILRASA
ncbi:MAG: PAS-domain containing protein [Pararhodobacter sp.]